MKKKNFATIIGMMMLMVSFTGCKKDEPVNADHPEVNINVDMSDMSESEKGVLSNGYTFNIPDGYRVDKVYPYDSHDHEDTKDTYYFDVLLYGDVEGEATGKMRVTAPCNYMLINDKEDMVIQVMDNMNPELFGSEYGDINNYSEVENIATKNGSGIMIYKLNDLYVGVKGYSNMSTASFIIGGYGEKIMNLNEFKEILSNDF